MSPKVSIVVPVYNVENYLNECVDSILKQTLGDIEVILIDDGSSDSSSDICDYYLGIDKRVKVIHKKNEGPSVARNAGIEIAGGEFVGFVDSDDWIDSDMYTLLVHSAYSNGSDIAVCNFFDVGRNGEKVIHTRCQEKDLYTKEEALSELYRNRVLTFSSWNKIYKKELFEELRFREGIILEDMDLSYKIIQKAEAISYINSPLYFYRNNENSILKSPFSLKRLDEYFVRKDMYDFYRREYPEIADKVYLECCNTGSYIFSLVKFHFKDKTGEYKYLTEYDSKILKRLCKRADLSVKYKLKALLFLFSPNLENNIRSIKYKMTGIR